MSKNIIPFQNFNLGGMADSKFSGPKDSSYKLIGVDLHTIPGVVLARQQMKQYTEVVNEFCKAKVACSNGKKYWFSSESGKIWEDDNGTFTLVYTTVPTRGTAACLSAREYSGYIYWTTANHLHRIAIGKLSNWSTGAVANWKDLDIDQEIVGTGQTYTVPASITEGPTARQTFTPEKIPQVRLKVYIVNKGTGNWTFVIHDSSNNVMAADMITNGNLTTGEFIVTFSTPWVPVLGTDYHLHIYSSVADGTIRTGSAGDLETCQLTTYTNSDTQYHPMVEQNLVLYIGDRNFVHQVDVYDSPNEFTKNALDIPYPWRVDSLGTFMTDVLVGAFLSEDVNTSQMFRWDGSSPSFINNHEVHENGIHAFLDSDTVCFVQCGRYGNIYVYNGETLELYKKVPGIYTPTRYGTVYPEAVANLDGMMLFGFSNLMGDPADSGIWCLGHYDRSYPFVTDLSFPISLRDDGEAITNGVEIGAILVSGHDLYASVRYDGVSWIDKLDYDNKIEKAVIESRVNPVERDVLQTASNFGIAFADLPDHTTVNAAVSVNYKPYTPLEMVIDTDRNMLVCTECPEGTTYQTKLELVTYHNDSPMIESAAITLE